MKHIRLLLGFILLCRPVAGSDLFVRQELLQMKIWMSFDTVLSDTGEDPSYRKISLSYFDKNDWKRMDAEIRVRGHFRKDPDHCEFPPLKLKFDKENRENTLFEPYKSLKMVTHCQNKGLGYEQFLLQEYLIYKMYNLFTDLSYRVRLLMVTYYNTDTTGQYLQKFAFLLEDLDDVAERNQAKVLELDHVNPERLNQDHFTMLSVFQYMIVNRDWSITILHNIDIIAKDYFEPPFPVPYDYDWAGLIDIPYGVPHLTGKTSRVPQRRFKGLCRRRREFKKVFRLFNEKKQELYRLCMNFRFLDEVHKRRTIQNLDIFYYIINDRYLRAQEFYHNCK